MDEKENIDKVKEKLSSILFDVITDIPESLYNKNDNPDKRIQKIIRNACIKSAAISTTLSIPAGVTGVLTAIPDIAAIWRLQAQLVSDIAATYGKFALLSREAMIWCLFRHSAAELLRDIAVRTGSRLILQKLSITALQTLLKKIGLSISTKFVGRIAMRAIPAIGAICNGAYTWYDTYEVGRTAATYFKAITEPVKQIESE